MQRPEILKEYCEVTVPDTLKKLQTLFDMNKNEDGFFVGREVTAYISARVLWVWGVDSDLWANPALGSGKMIFQRSLFASEQSTY